MEKKETIYFIPEYSGGEIRPILTKGDFTPSSKPDPYDFYDLIEPETIQYNDGVEDESDFKNYFSEFIDVPIFNGVFTVTYDSNITNLQKIEDDLNLNYLYYELSLEEIADSLKDIDGVISVDFR